MTIDFECGRCGKQLSTSEDKAGKTGKCPDCGEPVTVPQPAFGYEDDDPFDFESPAAAYAQSSPRRTTGPCPMCGAEVASTDRSCPYCGEDLRTDAERIATSEFSTGNKIDPGRIISEAWQRYTDQMGIAIGGMLLLGILSLIVNQIVDALQESGEGAAFLALIGSFVYNIWIGLGTAAFLLTIARGEPASISQLFSGGQWLGRGILATLVVALFGIPLVLIGVFLTVGAAFAAGVEVAILVGLICFVVGFFMILTFLWIQYVLVDIDAAGISCVGRSRELMVGNYFSVFAVMIVCLLVVLAGLLMLIVGLFFTVPFALVIWAMTYHHLSRGGGHRPGDVY